MTERLLVTGGSGFIGSEVVSLAMTKGWVVRNLDVRSPRNAAHHETWRLIDIRSGADVIREVLEFQPSRIVHLASEIDVNIKGLDGFLTTIGGTENVLSAISKLQELKSFVHISTQFVVKPGVDVPHERYLEPYTVYGAAKAESEKRVWAAGLEVPWFILRPTIVWGPYHPSFANQIFKYMASGRYLHPVARKPILRTFGYVDNVAEQIIGFAGMSSDGVRNRRVFYLGDQNMDYGVWADAFAVGLTGKAARRIPVGLLRLIGRAGDVVNSLGLSSPIDSGRAFRMSTGSKIDLEPTLLLLGSPTTSFDIGVATTLSWLRDVYSTESDGLRSRSL